APCPLVVTVHDAIPIVYYGQLGPALPWRLRAGYRLAMLAARRAARIITVSECSRRDMLTHLSITSDTVHVIYNGLDLPRIPSEEEERATLDRLGVRKPYLLYAGSYEPRKNVLGAVAAYRHALTRRELPPMVLI